MKTKKPSRIKYWLIILIGYVAIFLIGFFIPVAYNTLTHRDNQVATTTSSSSSSQESKQKSESVTTQKATTSAKTAKSHSKKATSKVQVAAGQTGYALATKYGLSVDELQELNPNVDLNNLSEDETLKIK